MTAPVPTSGLRYPAGELVQSLTYREAYGSVSAYEPPVRHRLTDHAPDLLRMAAGGAWALVSFTAAGCVLVVLVLAVVRVVGILT